MTRGRPRAAAFAQVAFVTRQDQAVIEQRGGDRRNRGGRELGTFADFDTRDRARPPDRIQHVEAVYRPHQLGICCFHENGAGLTIPLGGGLIFLTGCELNSLWSIARGQAVVRRICRKFSNSGLTFRQSSVELIRIREKLCEALVPLGGENHDCMNVGRKPFAVRVSPPLPLPRAWRSLPALRARPPIRSSSGCISSSIRITSPSGGRSPISTKPSIPA